MVNTMSQEVQRQEHRFIRKIIVDMEQEPMHPILQKSPDHVSDKEADRESEQGAERDRYTGR